MVRTYVVVVDDSPEALVALRFAARRAARTKGHVHIVTIIEPQDFVAFGGAAATMANEERERAQLLAEGTAAQLAHEFAEPPRISVREGKDKQDAVRDLLREEAGVSALVLGAAAHGDPGPLVTHFAGFDAGRMPCPVMIIPGGLTPEEIERLS